MAESIQHPFILVIDRSQSMRGDAIESVNSLVPSMVRILEDEPLVRESALLAIVTFNHEARVVLPLEPISSERLPKLDLEAKSTTLYSKAFHKVEDVLRSGRRRHSDKEWATPIVFFMTDGEPDTEDPWPAAAARLSKLEFAPQIYPIGFGEVKVKTLERIRTDETRAVTVNSGDIETTLRRVLDGVTRTIHYMTTLAMPDASGLPTEVMEPDAEDELEEFASDTDFHL